ncbi:hypothetical protein RF11_00522 [Thelohanellus kitauei]|uniref:Uncharacterized protein n=1 Tax=Thelohanellus kitauei TaxID=669202 RepID=A0A0C2N749_THEKT|nr:hypothetical protein RF11_00522 [Thelohanellus kitauei]
MSCYIHDADFALNHGWQSPSRGPDPALEIGKNKSFENENIPRLVASPVFHLFITDAEFEIISDNIDPDLNTILNGFEDFYFERPQRNYTRKGAICEPILQNVHQRTLQGVN